MEPPTAPVLEHEYAEETQGATQQASQYAAYGNPVHPMESPFFGCLQPCNTALRRIDFQKTQPHNAIGRGPGNNFILPGMRISACLALPWPSILPISSFSCALLTTRFCPFFFGGHAGFNHCQIMWDGREDSHSQVVVHDNSTNGTWVCHIPSAPIMRTADAQAANTDQRVARAKGPYAHHARRKRDRVWVANATAKPARRLPLHLPAPRAARAYGHPRTLRHGARAR